MRPKMNNIKFDQTSQVLLCHIRHKAIPLKFNTHTYIYICVRYNLTLFEKI